jgi:cell division septum initiation protein DivIVA
VDQDRGYSQGKIGVKQEPALVTHLKDEVEELTEEREELKEEVAELRQEVEDHKTIRNWIRVTFSRLWAIPLLVDAIRALSKAWPVFEELAEAVGVNLLNEPSLQVDRVANNSPKESQLKSPEQMDDIT